jgi:hypothetical protein
MAQRRGLAAEEVAAKHGARPTVVEPVRRLSLAACGTWPAAVLGGGWGLGREEEDAASLFFFFFFPFFFFLFYF